jgi:MYND finger
MTDLCKTCGKTGSSILMNCKRCKSVAYCSAECQRRDWKDHKPTCQRKEFAGAPCDCCGSTENVEGGDFCLKCGYHYCKACNEEHRTLDIDGDVASFAPCPSCQQKRDFISPSDCTKFEKLIKERPSDPRLANWLVTLGSRILLFDDTPRGEQKAKEHFVRAGELGYGEGFSCVAEINIGARNWDEARRFYLLAADK